MDRRVTIEQPSYAANSSGANQTKTWSTLSTVWAKKRLKTAGVNAEDYESDQKVARQKVEWTIWYLSTVTEEMRINEGGTYYYITHIQDVLKSGDREDGMILITEKRDNNE